MKKMRVLVACEYSGVVRDAFWDLGHEAWSCDLLPSEGTPDRPHYQGDVLDILDRGWDLMIAHPPCTYLSRSGLRWLKEVPKNPKPGVLYGEARVAAQQEALDFVRILLDAPIPRIALENPMSILSSQIRKPDQIIQPWMFGHPEKKATCLWLKNLPKLAPTNDVKAEMDALPLKERNRIHRMPPGPDRWKERSKTFEGIAAAMASQWSVLDIRSEGDDVESVA